MHQRGFAYGPRAATRSPALRKGSRHSNLVMNHGAVQNWRYVRWFRELGLDDLPLVGGKNASLGELHRRLGPLGVSVPDGFAVTAEAYRDLLAEAATLERLAGLFERFDSKAEKNLSERAAKARRLVYRAGLPERLEAEVLDAYRQLSGPGEASLSVAVRSSATAEDLPDASFAGQHDSFLNVCGAEALLEACRRCFASLFTERAITYRENQGIDHMKVAISVGVQRMVRADLAGAGVMFSIDTESGFPDVVLIDAAWGLGETVVQGTVDPDQYMVFKPLLGQGDFRPVIDKTMGSKERKAVYAQDGRRTTRSRRTRADERNAYVLADDEILQLARWASVIEQHYGRPMDMEWAKDGESGALFIVQARPETVQSRREATSLKTYKLKEEATPLLTGLSIGDAVAAGKVCRLDSPSQIDRFETGSILVTGLTDPDWVPIMRRAAAIITDHGGRTSHAAIVSRELGLPAIVGTGRATRLLRDGQEITVSCAGGDEGFVYRGRLNFTVQALPLDDIPKTRTKVMLNLANPAAALRWWKLPSDGVGLARMEFIINNLTKIHPMALVNFERLKDRKARREIEALTRGFEDKTRYFVESLAHGIARIAAAHHPNPVILRMSDFKTNEYARLIGGEAFEPREENPMLGWRGASRYYSEGYRAGFALECQAVRKVRQEIGLDNVIVMIPFCRTLEEADRTLQVMAENGLARGENGLEVYVMCEIPSNVILAEGFSKRFDGFSIGSNDLTQLTLGVDRDSELLAELFDEENEAVTSLIESVIRAAHLQRRKVGFCGQAPSDRPDFARFLVRAGIDSISITPDSFLAVKRQVAAAERKETAGAIRPGTPVSAARL